VRSLFTTFFTFILFIVSAQENNNSEFKGANFISFRLHTGKVINNYIYFDSFPARNPSALIEIKFGKQTNGSKNWQQAYGFPQVGISAIGGYLGNNRQLGYMAGILPNVALNTANKKKWSMKVRLGLGFAYFNKPFDSLTNPHNILIGSHITALAMADFYFKRSLSKKLDFEFGLSIIHASNGHTGLPNVGLNMVNINAGLKYYLNKQAVEFYKKDKIPINKNLIYHIRFGLGTHKFGNELGPVNSPSYKVFDAAFYIGLPLGSLGSAYAGIAYKYYSSFYEKIIEENIYDEKQKLKSSVITILLAYEFEMGQMSLLAEGGINIYSPFWQDYVQLIGDQWSFGKKIEGLLSSRLGLQYYFLDKEKFDKNIYLGLYIKANFGSADFVSLSTGFKF